LNETRQGPFWESSNVERKIARRDGRRIAMAIKIAHFPTACDRDDFDFAARLSLDPRQIGEFARSCWVAHGEALLRWGHAAGTQEARHDGALHPRHRQSGRPPYVKFI
jgi:IstB-like ATP binding protein